MHGEQGMAVHAAAAVQAGREAEFRTVYGIFDAWKQSHPLQVVICILQTAPVPLVRREHDHARNSRVVQGDKIYCLPQAAAMLATYWADPDQNVVASRSVHASR